MKTMKVVILVEGSWYVAQCLESDIATQAKTIPEILEAIQVMLADVKDTAIELNLPYYRDLPAPAQYWRMFDTGTTVACVKIFDDIPDLEIRLARQLDETTGMVGQQ